MKNSAKLCLCALLFLLCTCDNAINVDPDTGFEIFTIPAGSHNSIIRNEPFTGTGIDIKVIFDESAEYTLEVASDQADINKLTGFSDCAQHHQSESGRIGWRWFNDELQLLAYTYLEGNLSFELMGAVALNTEVDLSIRIVGDTYQYSGTGLQSVTMQRSSNCETGENYWLWPYFGGNQTAPQAVKIQMKRTVIE